MATLLDQIMFLFTVPVLKIAIQVGIGLIALFVIIQVIRWSMQSNSPNPFRSDDRKPRKPYIVDQRKRDEVLKQSFSPDKVPDQLDAIIIGSGIGGMATGAMMAKAGKRVLILEQHDQAGGCCHTFIDKGYEFDVGIHYIGKMSNGQFNRTFLDQISEGQIEWAPLDDAYDVVSIGYDENHREYPVLAGFDNWKKLLKKHFPSEEKGIDKFFELLDEYNGNTMFGIMMKVLPLWVSKIVCTTPLLRFFTNLWSGEKDKTTLEIVQSLTDDKDLQTAMTYCWGDFGTVPEKSHFSMMSLLHQHYRYGAFYPGYDESNRRYPVLTGFDKWKSLLKKQFPGEENAIDKFFHLLKEYNSDSMFSVMIKVLPLWLSKLICSTPLMRFFSKLWHGEYDKTTFEIINDLTDNKDLQTALCYCWGDFGTVPEKCHFSMMAGLHQHFKLGGFYPVGGASEIALNIIPVIEKTGGRVLVKADVTDILHNGKKVHGIIVKKGSEKYKIEAPLVISSAGVYNTFQRLLPPQVAEKSYFLDICKQLKPGVAAMNIFIGLNASNEELNLKAHNIWAFNTNDTQGSLVEYMEKDVEAALDAEIPLLFISFPSAKDPNWKNHPGREGKSTCVAVTLANWEWYKRFEKEPVKRRGDEYEGIKNTVGEIMLEQICKLFPQIRDHIDYKDIGTPVTNKHYIAQPHGEIYGLDHTRERMHPLMASKLRAKTDIPGLYLTGQDILSCGFTGALFASLLTASAVLERNVLNDLIALHKETLKQDKSKSQ